MFGNPLTNQDLLTLAQASAEQKSAGLNLPEKYILATPISGYGFPAYRLFDAAYISTGIIDPNRLGTGSTGAGNLYLADDGTWKLISGAPGVGDMLKATYDVDNDGIVDSAERIQILVRNSTGSTLTKGTVVYLSGATGNRPNAVRAQANTEATSSKTFGIVVANITNNADGYVACNGTLHDLDTSAFTAGDALWLSATTAGAYTSTIPVEPNHTVFIGYVARAHPTQGRLVILIQNGYELNELHGVLIASEANNDLLVYETSTTLWKNKSISTIFGGTPLVSVPTLAQVTTAGNTTTNAITVGGLIVDTNTLVVDSVNDRVVIGATTATNKLEIFGTGTSGGVSSNVGYNIQPVVAPVITGVTYALQAGTALEIGTYYYRVTYYNAIGETNASNEILVTTTAGNRIVQLNNIPTSTDASVIGRKIYRNKVTDSSAYGVVIATLANNTTTTYTDSTPDTDPIFSGNVLTRPIYSKANTTARYIAVSGVRSMIVDPSLTTFGVNAGAAITVAPNVTLFGVNAGQNITYGGGNTLFGANAGSTITGGFENVAIGPYALFQVTTGSYNIGIGPFTNNRNNSHTIALGYYTGNSTTGDNNILIGGYIGSSTLAMTNSVIIGHNATPLAATNNQINIANTIYGRSNTGNVQIGTTTDAGYKLDVNGTARTSQLHTFSQGTYLDALTTNYFYTADTGTGTYGGLALKNSINNYSALIYTGRSGANNSIVFEHLAYSGTPTAQGSQKFGLTWTTFGVANNGTYGHTLTVHQRLGGLASYPLVITNQINTTNSGVGILMQTADSTATGPINSASIVSWKQNLTAPNVTSDMRFSTISDAANTLSEKMRISSAGNLLVGTTTGTSKLTVSTSSVATAFSATTVGDSNWNPIATFNNTPASNTAFGLQIQAYSDAGNRIIKIVGDNTTNIYVPNDISANNWNLFNCYYNNYWTDATFYLRNTTGGLGGFKFTSIVTGTLLSIIENGNVLIGTTTNAGYKLDVNGTARVQGAFTATLANVSTANVVYYNSSTGLMTYGTAPVGAQFVIDYDPNITGTKNGSNLLFTTSSTFIATTTRVFLNGQRLTRGATYDYVETGTNQITFTNAPTSTDLIIIEYQI